MTEVRGLALVPMQSFILENFGKDGLILWTDALNPEAKKVYTSPIDPKGWFSLNDMFIEPTQALCDLFYDNNLSGGWEFGKYSAEFALNNFLKAFLRVGSVKMLFRVSSTLLPRYYSNSKGEMGDIGTHHAIFRITQFDGMVPIVEARIGGWIQRAMEICLAREVNVRICESLNKGDDYTEFKIMWD